MHNDRNTHFNDDHLPGAGRHITLIRVRRIKLAYVSFTNVN